ncbi:MAG TPA: hypothetical protein DDZ51_02200 [Planctomycetaceae bacterium]|nr:hypothetical protein [Planctomycetaceae bacterium]
MRVTLEGPDDLGNWFVSDEDGNSFTLVECYEDHPTAASMLGWKSPDGIDDEDEIIQDALDWLMEHTGDDFTAPKHVADYFKEMNDDE